MNDILVKIEFLLPTLPKAEKKIAEFLFNDIRVIEENTLSDLSEITGCSEASIIRFCKRAGYDGFLSFKQAVLMSMVDNDVSQVQEIDQGDSMETILQKVFQNNTKTLNDTLSLVTNDYNRALDVLLKVKSLHFFGVGDAYYACAMAHMKFSRIGIRGSAYEDAVQQLIVASSLEPGDVAFAVSYSGSSRTTVQAMRTAQESGATTICITNRGKSPLLKYCDIHLFTATFDTTVGRGVATRRVADQAILEALYLGVLAKSDRDHEKYLRRSAKAVEYNKI